MKLKNQLTTRDRRHRFQHMAAIFLTVAMLAVVFAIPAAADVTSGLTSARDTVTSTLKTILIDVVAKIARYALVGILLFLICTGLYKKHNSDDYSNNVKAGVICFVALALVWSFSTWGPMLWE